MENIGRDNCKKREDAPHRIRHPWDQPTGRSVDDIGNMVTLQTNIQHLNIYFFLIKKVAKQAAKDFKFSTPWESDEAENLADFERDLANMTMKHSPHPWETAEDMRNVNAEKEKAKDYKYKSLFEPEPLTEQQVSDY